MSTDTISILDGSTFLVSDLRGDVEASPDTPHGFVFRDTRFLSRWTLTANGAPLGALSTDENQYFSASSSTSSSAGRETRSSCASSSLPRGRRSSGSSAGATARATATSSTTAHPGDGAREPVLEGLLGLDPLRRRHDRDRADRDLRDPGLRLLLLRALLGLEPDGDELRVDPHPPDGIGRIELRGIPGRWGRADATAGRLLEVQAG
jgi:hypothetical protein